ncbi:MAG TPA: hypothetical protein VH309_09105 [Elusimicrobiota bacterium]|nr:hypothetical protein [Elusimicrobiota bacterium]
MKQAMKALAMSAAVLLTAAFSSAAPETGEADLGAAAQTISADVTAQVGRDRAAQAGQVADLKKAAASQAASAAAAAAKPAPQRVMGAGKGLRTEEYPIDPRIEALHSHVLRTELTTPMTAAPRLLKADYSWRRNDWGVCRAWLDCASGRRISCWAEGWNCDAYSNAGSSANVFCKSWDDQGHWSSSWDTCP